MSKTFVISDLHGRFDLLEKALEQIEHASPSGGKIVATGDYIDRGLESRQIIERLMKGPPEGWEWVCLLGNHEEFMYGACTYGRDTTLWLMNGGALTLFSYGQRMGDIANPGLVPFEHTEWIKSLPWYYEDEHRIYVHAGVVHGKHPRDTPLESLIWLRYADRYQESYMPNGKHVVHGHEPYEDGPLLLKSRTDLDTNAVFTGRLVVGVFDDDKPGGPVSTITIQGKTMQEILDSHHDYFGTTT